MGVERAELGPDGLRPVTHTVLPLSPIGCSRKGDRRERVMTLVRVFLADARHAQIAVLSTLILLGISVFDFNIPP